MAEKFRITAADAAGAAKIVSNLSEHSTDEFERAGLDPRAVVTDALEGPGPVFISWRGTKPLTVFGFNDFGDYFSMWSLASADYYRLGARGVAETRKFFRNLGLGKPLVVTTASTHPQTQRWLEILGFERVGTDYVLRV